MPCKLPHSQAGVVVVVRLRMGLGLAVTTAGESHKGLVPSSQGVNNWKTLGGVEGAPSKSYFGYLVKL